MKLATLRTDHPDGELVVVSRDLTRISRVKDIAPTLQPALDRWAESAPKLRSKYRALNESRSGEKFEQRQAASLYEKVA